MGWRRGPLITSALLAPLARGILLPARGAHPVRGKGRAHPPLRFTSRTFFQPDACGLQAP